MSIKWIWQVGCIVLLTLLISQCKSGPRRYADEPRKIIPRPKMQAVLTDIHIAEGAAKADSIPRDSSDYYARVYHKAVLEKHNLSREKYQRSIRYYVENPDVMVSMYEPMMKELKARKKALNKDK